MAAVSGPAGIAGLLSEELKTLEAFVALLRREQSLLAEANADALAALATEKSELATRLTQCSTQRERRLVADGLGTGRDGMNAWLATPAGSAGHSAWQRLLDLAAEARNLNETNGKLIRLRLQHNQQALAVLMSVADQVMTYGPDGQQRGGAGGRSLGSA